MDTWQRVAALDVEIAGYELEGLERAVSSGFERLSTVVRMHGGGESGLGEDVTYDAVDHIALQDAGPTHDLSGAGTVGELCELVGSLDLFPAEPERDVSRAYRRWAFESAALDLALRQRGASLAELVERPAEPVRYVVSLRLGDPPTATPVHERLERYPSLRFKLDPTAEWTPRLVEELAATGAVDTLDLKGHYRGTVVDVDTDPELYRLLLARFPRAWIEDPDVSDETRPLLEPHAERVTWDAPIHSIADIEAAPWPPRMVNIKPSRMGGLRGLLDAYAYCEAQEIAIYGGGQFELGPGRGQIQYLASLFHADAPNDVSPAGFHGTEVPPGLPTSPLTPRLEPTGFRWRADAGR